MGKYNLESKLKDLLADDRVRVIVEKYSPGSLKHPLIGMVGKFTINKSLQYRSVVGLSKEDADNLLEEVLALD